MAEEAKKDTKEAEKDTKEAEEAQPPPKSKLKLIVLASTVLLLGVGGFFGWKWYAARKVASAATQKAKVGTSIVYPLESFIVNLADKKGIGKRYLKLTMEIEVNGLEQRALVDHKGPQLRDAVLLMLSSRTIAEITSMEAKLELKQILLVRMNRAVGENVIQRVYFTEFVVQ